MHNGRGATAPFIASIAKAQRMSELRALRAKLSNLCDKRSLVYTVALDESAEQVTIMIGDRSHIVTMADIKNSDMAGTSGIADAIVSACISRGQTNEKARQKQDR